ncbi:hypothetical protein NC653_026455 [Populus alba x Populus x berolinensis]|uniref:Uncharacterized protein n=1 Tax=Populus alba x Populus x berolinensis TaxID=444605 RepID=A0AAD6MDR7_9ROSI|nr:hypothetical protein NC653_026455 [Populus alba x Populus x berolinensis]
MSSLCMVAWMLDLFTPRMCFTPKNSELEMCSFSQSVWYTISPTQPKNQLLRFLLLVVQMPEQFLCRWLSSQQELMMEFLPKHSRPMFIPFKRSSPALASPEPSLDSSKKACTFVFHAINNYSLGSESRLMFVRTSKS